jgi:hypothetical protein
MKTIIDTLTAIRERFLGGRKRLAQDVLKEHEGDNRFYLQEGPPIASMYELVYMLRDMSDEQFEYHVNHERNDFSNWVHDVLGDRKLAADIRNLKDKRNMVLRVAERYGEHLEQLRD